jgi:hypothetical protein
VPDPKETSNYFRVPGSLAFHSEDLQIALAKRAIVSWPKPVLTGLRRNTMSRFTCSFNAYMQRNSVQARRAEIRRRAVPGRS